jgi:hypothetical protein
MKPKNLEKGEEITKICGIPKKLFPSWLTHIEILIYHYKKKDVIMFDNIS